jgi:hypothetical protein
VLALAIALVAAHRASAQDDTARGVVAGVVRTPWQVGPQILVGLPQLGISTRTDSAGRFRFDGVPDGTWLLETRRLGMTPLWRSVDVHGDSVPALELQLQPLPIHLVDHVCRTVPASPPPGEPVKLTWIPARPPPGSVLVVRAYPAPLDGMSDRGSVFLGALDTVPLVFDALSRRRFVAVTAVPRSAKSALRLLAIVDRASGAIDSVSATLHVALEREADSGDDTSDTTVAADPRTFVERDLERRVLRRSMQTPRLWSGHFSLASSDSAHASAPALARGVVALVADFAGRGRVVYVDHGGGLVSAYAMLARSTVAIGDTVNTGQSVGEGSAWQRSVFIDATPIDARQLVLIPALPPVPVTRASAGSGIVLPECPRRAHAPR